MEHNSLKSMKKSMKIKEKISIFDINLRLYILHNIQWFKHEPTSGHWFLVRRFYKVRTMIMTLKIVPKKFGSMVFPWHGHDVCYSLYRAHTTLNANSSYHLRWDVVMMSKDKLLNPPNKIHWSCLLLLCTRTGHLKAPRTLHDNLRIKIPQKWVWKIKSDKNSLKYELSKEKNHTCKPYKLQKSYN